MKTTAEKPILFNADMVRAVLNGSKTQTRRMVKGAPSTKVNHRLISFEDGWNWQVDQEGVMPTIHREMGDPIPCPFGKVGDRLWVRETFAVRIEGSLGNAPRKEFLYRASTPDDVYCRNFSGQCFPQKWTPSIHMPRSASRITLEITDVRADRLHSISEDDAEREGVAPSFESNCGKIYPYPLYTWGFRKIWESIYGNWDSNPWVWVVEFKRVQQSTHSGATDA